MTETPLFETHIRKTPGVDFTEQRKPNLEIAIQRWWRFLKIDHSCSQFGKIARLWMALTHTRRRFSAPSLASSSLKRSSWVAILVPPQHVTGCQGI